MQGVLDTQGAEVTLSLRPLTLFGMTRTGGRNYFAERRPAFPLSIHGEGVRG